MTEPTTGVTAVVTTGDLSVGTPVAQLFLADNTPFGPPVTDGFTILTGMVVWSGRVPVGFVGTVRIASTAGWSREHPVQGSTPQGTPSSDPSSVSHDYTGPDRLAYRTLRGEGIGGAIVQAFHKGDNTPAASTVTKPDGRWVSPLRLTPGEYVLVFEKPGLFGPDSVPLTVGG